MRIVLAAPLALFAATAAAQVAPPVESFVTGSYYHGLPRQTAELYGPEAVPALIELLGDETRRESWGQIVSLLGTIGADAATPALIDFVESRFEGEIGFETYGAISLASNSLGDIARQGGERALRWLEEGATPEGWRARDVRWTTPMIDETARARFLAEDAIRGLGMVGTSRSFERLREVRDGLRDDAEAESLRPALNEAIAVNRLIQEAGDSVLRAPDLDRRILERMEIAPRE